MDHTHAVWAVEFHSAGHYMASASMDHCSKLWDVTAERSIFSFRGHLDSVNSVCWHGTLIATASSDKTIAVWDPRSGSCVQTFSGHVNSCNYVTASPKVHTFTAHAKGCLILFVYFKNSNTFLLGVGVLAAGDCFGLGRCKRYS